MYAREDKPQNKYSNKQIETIVRGEGFTLLDIIQDGEVKVTLQDTDGYIYTVSFRKLLAGKEPRFKPTPHNVEQVCINNGVRFVKNLDGVGTNSFKIQYELDGRYFDKNFYVLKERGHLKGRLLTLEDITPQEGVVLTKLYKGDGKLMLQGLCEEHGEFDNPYYAGSEYDCHRCSEEWRHKNTRIYDEYDVYEHAKEYSINHIITGRQLVRYTCCNGHEPITMSFRSFMDKTSNRCNKCTQAAGMQYHKGTVHKYEDVPGLLYVVTLSDGLETFTKVGITKTSLKERMHRQKGYNVIRSTTYPMSIADAYRIEQLTLNTYKEYKYKPLVQFVGHTECLIASPQEIEWFVEKEIECSQQNN